MVIFNNFLIIKEPRMFEAASGGRVPQGSHFHAEEKADPPSLRFGGEYFQCEHGFGLGLCYGMPP